MKVHIAKKAGFCMGVRRAVDLTLDLVHKESGTIVTYGPLIHNPQVLDVLGNKGVGILDGVPGEPSAEGTVIIRAHGVPPAEKERLQASGLRVKDATCPRVLKVQAIISKHRKQGRLTVIIGDRNHAEVLGLMGYAGEGCLVVSDEADARAINITGPYIIVSQTTQDEASFEKLSEIIMARFPDGLVFNTICDSTHLRQDEVKNLCRKVEALVVVGGKNSANTKRLAEIAQGMGVDVFLVETEEEIDAAAMRAYDQVGVTAGASTPSWMINRVVRVLEGIPGRSEGVMKAMVFQTIRVLMASNAYVAVAGALLTAACSVLMGIRPMFDNAVVSFGYIFAMHNFNRLGGTQSDTFHDPMLSSFCRRHKSCLLALSFLLLLVCFFLTFRQGSLPFLVLCAMTLFGLLYSIHFFPRFLAERIKVSRLKEIPGSKTVFVALAWAVMVAVLPGLSQGAATARIAGCFVFIMFMVMVRNALFDIFQVQGDRIAGKETLPVVIGVEKTMTMLTVVMWLLAVCGVALPALGLLAAPLGYFLLPGLGYLGLYLYLYRKGRFSPGVRAEFGLETAFVAASAIILAADGLL